MEQTELREQLKKIALKYFFKRDIDDRVLNAMEDALSLNRSVPTKVTDEEITASTNAVLGDVIDSKVNQLLSLTDEFIFPAYYSHEGKAMWKISNVYTKYASETFVLCGVDEGIEKAIDLAIEHISKAKDKFYKLGV